MFILLYPGPLARESDALPTALSGPAIVIQDISFSVGTVGGRLKHRNTVKHVYFAVT